MDTRVRRTIASFMPHIFQKRSENKSMVAMMTIMKDVELREEISLEKLSPRIITLPLDLLQCELITKQEPASDTATMEIVDDIFMPLIHVPQQQ